MGMVMKLKTEKIVFVRNAEYDCSYIQKKKIYIYRYQTISWKTVMFEVVILNMTDFAVAWHGCYIIFDVTAAVRISCLCICDFLVNALLQFPFDTIPQATPVEVSIGRGKPGILFLLFLAYLLEEIFEVIKDQVRPWDCKYIGIYPLYSVVWFIFLYSFYRI